MGSTRTIRTPLPVKSAPGARGGSLWLFCVLFFAVAANLPYWVAARAFGFLPLGWFCELYMLAGFAAMFVPRFVSAILLLVSIFADLLCGICLTYRLPIHETLANIGSAHAFAAPHLLLACLALLLCLLAAAATLLLPIDSMPQKQRWRAAAWLMGLAILVVGADAVSITLARSQLPVQLNSTRGIDAVNVQLATVPRLARVPIVRLAQAERKESRMMALEGAGRHATPLPSAAAVALAAAGILPATGTGDSPAVNPASIDDPAHIDSRRVPNYRDLPNVVLVVVESWGLADAPLREALVAPYQQPALLDRYQVMQGTVPFHGSTIPGESRELCGDTLGYHLLTATASELTHCLPDRLVSLGYYPIALHGMNGNMFNRSHWYTAIGFKESWFHDDFRQQGLPDCGGAFVGACDADVAAWLGRWLRNNRGRPNFVHWMTLNSHVPVAVPSGLAAGAACIAALQLKPDTPLCSWYQLVANVHRSVARIAAADLRRPTVFIVVGDHSPPFGDPAIYHRFSFTEVPYLILLPRTGTGQQTAMPPASPRNQ
jgi:Sulfatase